MERPSASLGGALSSFATWWPGPDDASDPKSKTTLPHESTQKLLALFSMLNAYIAGELERCGKDDAPAP